jgi:hypothetical protein
MLEQQRPHGFYFVRFIQGKSHISFLNIACKTDSSSRAAAAQSAKNDLMLVPGETGQVFSLAAAFQPDPCS